MNEALRTRLNEKPLNALALDCRPGTFRALGTTGLHVERADDFPAGGGMHITYRVGFLVAGRFVTYAKVRVISKRGHEVFAEVTPVASPSTRSGEEVQRMVASLTFAAELMTSAEMLWRYLRDGEHRAG